MCTYMQSRMESNGVPGCIHASSATMKLLPDEEWISTGGVLAKGALRFVRIHVCCVCMGGRVLLKACLCVHVCVCVRVCVREREREYVCVRVSFCWEWFYGRGSYSVTILAQLFYAKPV